MKKKTILWLLIVCFALTPVLYGLAAGSFSMNYYSGTSDPVTNLPDTQSGLTGGEAFTVSSREPKREGFEFIDWTLDYETEQPTEPPTEPELPTEPPTEPPPTEPEPPTEPPTETEPSTEPTPPTEPPTEPSDKIYYSVVYISILENIELDRSDHIAAAAGVNVEEYAKEFDGYQVMEPSYICRPVRDGDTLYFYYLPDIGG